MNTPFTERMIRASRLDPAIYEEVEADPTANGQAAAVIVLASIAAGIGQGSFGIGALLLGSVAALVAWMVWAALTWVIGTRLLPEPGTSATWGELLRTIAFSSSPGILRVLGIVPGLSGIVFFAAGIWMLVAMVVAVRQALDFTSTGRAVGVCLVGWLVQVVLLALLFALVRPDIEPV